MFEKEAEIYALSNYGFRGKNSQRVLTAKIDYQDGAEFGYNKAKEDADKMKSRFLELCNLKDMRIEKLEKANEWHEDSPTEDIRLAIIEVKDCGYLLCEYRKGVWYDEGSSAVCKDWITRNIKRWKEIVLPELKEVE